MSHAVSTAHLDAAQKAQFQQLTRAPKLAWITLSMCAVLVIGTIATDALAVSGYIALGCGLVINSVIGYLAFSVVHDSIHRSISTRQRLNDIRTLAFTAGVAALLFTLIATGYGVEVLMLWFLPSRLVQMALGFSFFWLPHAPHDTAQEDNFTRATTVRHGHEWLLDPALQYQNYHLIHHLWPGTPFYNNGRVYQLMRSELERHDQAIQQGFSIRPEIRPAASALRKAA